jgi:hypothetical protein
MDSLWITVGVVVALPLGFIVVPAMVDAMMRIRRTCSLPGCPLTRPGAPAGRGVPLMGARLPFGLVACMAMSLAVAGEAPATKSPDRPCP